MNKIIVIGSPGSGKSTFSLKLSKVTNIKLLHLDKVYHIDNDKKISRSDLLAKVHEFDKKNSKWIIDGNYISTLEERVHLCDSVIILDIDTDICLKNIMQRTKKAKTPDMSDGFNNSIITSEFVERVSSFKEKIYPRIESIVQSSESKRVILLNNYDQIEDFLLNIKLKH